MQIARSVDGKLTSGGLSEKIFSRPFSNIESFFKRSTHICDSQFGVPNGHGFTFRYSHSLDKIIGFRVASILVDGIVGPFSTPIYLALHSNLSRAGYSGHRNGTAENIISAVYNPGTAARIVWNYDLNQFVPIEIDTINDLYFELRDPSGTPQPQFRFVVHIEFTHAF